MRRSPVVLWKQVTDLVKPILNALPCCSPGWLSRLLVCGVILVLIRGPLGPISERLGRHHNHNSSIDSPFRHRRRSYQPGDFVELKFINIGPYGNPHERYDTPLLAFPCTFPSSSSTSNNHTTQQDDGVNTSFHHNDNSFKTLSLSRRMTIAMIQIPPEITTRPHTMEMQCTMSEPMSKDRGQQLTRAIREHWLYELNLDGLPVRRGKLGWSLDESRLHEDWNNSNNITYSSASGDATIPTVPSYVIYNRRSLEISMNVQNEIVRVELRNHMSTSQQVKEGASGYKLGYTLEVSFVRLEGEQRYEDRWNQFYDESKFITRWLNVLLSCLLVGALQHIQRVMMVGGKINKRARTTSSTYDKNELDRNSGNGAATSSLRLALLPREQLHDHFPGGGGDWDSAGTYQSIFEQPSHLPILASLVGTGAQFLPVAWIVICDISWGEQPLPPLARLESENVLRLMAVWTAIWTSSLWSGYVSTKMVLLFARSDVVREDMFGFFQDELKLSSNRNITNDEDESSDGMDDDEEWFHVMKNDDSKYVSRMVWTTATMAGTVGLGFHLCVFVSVQILSRIRGTDLDVNLTFLIITALMYGALFSIPPFLFGVCLAHRQTLRDPVADTVTSTLPHLSSDPFNPRQPQHFTSSLTIVSVAGAINAIPICLEVGNCVFDSILGYAFYMGSTSVVLTFLLALATTVLTTRMALYRWFQNGRKSHGNGSWQWIAFGSGAATSFYVFANGIWYLLTIVITIRGWYEILVSLCILTTVSIDIGLLFGAVSYLSGYYYVNTIFVRKAM